MRRRALLASLATGTAALAGCSLGSLGDDERATAPGPDETPGDGQGGLFGSGPTDRSPGTRTDTPPGTATDRSTAPPGPDGDGGPGGTDSPDGTDAPNGEGELAWPGDRASVIDLETEPRTYAFAPTGMHTDDGAEVALSFDRTATAESPARLSGWIRNGNDYANTFRVQWIPAVGRVHARQPAGYDHEAALHLAPTGENELAETVPDLARTDAGYWYATDLGSWMPETVRLDPGEHRQLAYAVVGERGMPGRPTGTYEFRGDDERARVVVWDATSPGPEADSRFAGRSVPAPGERTVGWYHDADRSTRAFVRPSTERLELDGRVVFEMVNHSRASLQCGHWDLYKLVDGEWFHVAPRVHFSDCRSLAPGATAAWALRAFDREAVGCGCEGRDSLTRGYLGGGTYAAVTGYGYPEGEPTGAHGALVELVGDPAPVVPEESATVERHYTTATVTTERYGDGEHPPDARFALERADATEERGVERVVAEQVMGGNGPMAGDGGLRNGLPFLTGDEGVERVVVRTDEHAVDGVVAHDASSRRFRFRGEVYEASRVDAETDDN